MAYRVLITQVATGEQRVQRMPGTWAEDAYSWEEGNFACDCNRAYFFDGIDAACGEGGYTVALLTEED